MRFADIIGNSDSVATLRAMADSGHIPHALLISGPSGIGKMQLARAFISYINCENRRNGDSCGLCPSCRRIDAGNNPDLHYVYPICRSASPKRTVSTDFIDAWMRMLKDYPYMEMPNWLRLMEAGNSQPAIYVDEAEAIAAKAAVSTFADRFKIFLIWLPERMLPATANKLLKLLEEPYEDTLFICVSNDPGAILPTILSRLRRIEMRRPPADETEKALARRGISPRTAANTAHLCEGSLARAFQIISSSGESEELAAYFRDAMRLAYAKNAARLKQLSETLAALGREKSIRVLDYFARMTRENFIANLCTPPLNVMTEAEAEFSGKFAPFIHAGNVEKIIADIDKARNDIARNANSKIVWFDTLIRLIILLRIKHPQVQPRT